MSVKTSSRSAVLAYNAGTANSNDFVAVEVRNANDYDLVNEFLIAWAIKKLARVTKAMMARTIALAYNAGTANSNDFVAVEVRNPDDSDLVAEGLIASAIVFFSKSNFSYDG